MISVLLLILKVLGWALAAIAGVASIALLLSVRVKVAGEAGFTGSIGDLLDGVAVLVLGWRDKDGDSGPVADSASDSVVLDGTGSVRFSALGGILALDARARGASELSAFGIRVRSWQRDGMTEDAKADVEGAKARRDRKRTEEGSEGGEGSVRREDSRRVRRGKWGTGSQQATDTQGDVGTDEGSRFRRVLKGFSEAKRYLAPTVRARTLVFVKQVWCLLHVDLDVDVEYGFDDPGYTGMLYAAYLSAGSMLGLGGLRLRPNFTVEMLEISGKLQLRLIPVSLAWSFACFALSKSIRPLWWKKWRARVISAEKSS